MAKYNAILKGGTFMFEIGPEECRFVIHKKVVAENSPVFSALMTNGSMYESTSGIAHLEDTDPQTFGLFAEYAYTGMYRVEEPPPDEPHKDYRVECSNCNQSRKVESQFSAISRACPDCMSCYITIKNVEGGAVWRGGSKPREYPFGVGLPKPGSKDFFRAMNFPALGKSHKASKQYLATLEPPDLSTEDVLAHAKLYVFADEYMIDALKELSLHKLHRDLLQLKVKPDTAIIISDLLIYVYHNTSVPDYEIDSGEKLAAIPTNPLYTHNLRTLVLTFVIANVKELISCSAFDAVYSEGNSELIADLMEGTAQRLKD